MDVKGKEIDFMPLENWLDLITYHVNAQTHFCFVKMIDGNGHLIKIL